MPTPMHRMSAGAWVGAYAHPCAARAGRTVDATVWLVRNVGGDILQGEEIARPEVLAARVGARRRRQF